ncbi:acyl-CoA thioesterase-1 [Marinobacter gudaonensis]|uniref:Acyl-CoA thioesterase-1 n=1 Tax=Marinobacter gudaonensis TaxID=375760 RepID=A0A1I6G624_9GAMM|nr:arylesterase [Marinobacter gudaonensis]SFR37646.1 acyl-CoA thioesterase-1 [Marinobacter gudaonensis]
MHTALVFVRSIVFLAAALFAVPVLASQNTLLIVGDSLSAAYGIPSEAAWVQLLRNRLDKNGLGNWTVVNASISGETTDGGARRLPELIEENAPEVVVIELGGNDGLRGFPPQVIQSNLASMIEQVQDAGARAVLVGMQIPPNYGQRYTEMFANIYPTLSDRYNTALVPFFLDGIYNQEGMMQDDGIHPSEQAQGKLLDNIWPVLKPILTER